MSGGSHSPEARLAGRIGRHATVYAPASLTTLAAGPSRGPGPRGPVPPPAGVGERAEGRPAVLVLPQGLAGGGVEGLEDLALITNGVLLAKLAAPLRAAGRDVARVLQQAGALLEGQRVVLARRAVRDEPAHAAVGHEAAVPGQVL